MKRQCYAITLDAFFWVTRFSRIFVISGSREKGKRWYVYNHDVFQQLQYLLFWKKCTCYRNSTSCLLLMRTRRQKAASLLLLFISKGVEIIMGAIIVNTTRAHTYTSRSLMKQAHYWSTHFDTMPRYNKLAISTATKKKPNMFLIDKSLLNKK